MEHPRIWSMSVKENVLFHVMTITKINFVMEGAKIYGSQVTNDLGMSLTRIYS